jgi:hypothetical protein
MQSLTCCRDSGRQRWSALGKTVNAIYASTYWSDRNPSTYRNWAPGRPNTLYTCMWYQDGYFYDDYCATSLYFTCKKAAGNEVKHCWYFILMNVVTLLPYQIVEQEIMCYKVALTGLSI